MSVERSAAPALSVAPPPTRRANASPRLSGRATVILLAILAVVVIYATDQVAPASSDRQAQMRIWLAARATGVVTLLLLTFQICVGLVLSHPTNKSTWRLSKRIFPWHENLWVFVTAFLGVHIVSLLLDPYAGVGIAGTFIPGLSGYRSSPVALGTLALYAFLITAVSARWTRLLPAGMWLSIHRLALIVFGLSLAPRDAGRDRLGCAARPVHRDRPRRRAGRRLSLLGVPQGAAVIRDISHGGQDPMNIGSLHIRRSLTVFGVVGAILLGLAAIQGAAAWTATSAPLSVVPVSATSIEAQLLEEQARSADLQAQLLDLSINAGQLSTALEAAQARIDADSTHAKDLERDLQTAKKKLAALQRSIRVTSATSTSASAASAPSSGGHDDDDDEDEHDEEEDD